MSAINAIVTPSASYMISDGLRYNNGEVTCVDYDKSFVLRGMRAAVAATGDAKTGHFFRAAIEGEFTHFEDVIAAGSEFFVEGFKAFAHRFCGGNAVSNAVLIGWLESENRPAAFAIDLQEGLGKWGGASRSVPDAQNGVLGEHPIIASPCPSLEELLAAQYPIGSAGDGVSPEAKLLHMLEVQRRMRADDGNYYVGGHALLTSIDASGVRQRVVYRWPNDKVGEVIGPERDMDWKAFRRELKGGRWRWR
ncbi:hypothetical protein IVB30_19735 [Bradyrhizobium sp. 200]|uniref:hypothetical protein n=1 Tax=Bradyrhizobium sp. 200 TaxID=2782665 RepID=UPI001FFF2F05|nr:hypothetical protein [Bradyrhizobium sp. 200]UPJ53345.1 hypothetical protein IVB30_19735 [Bradyrhizobium sp. 200]